MHAIWRTKLALQMRVYASAQALHHARCLGTPFHTICIGPDLRCQLKPFFLWFFSLLDKVLLANVRALLARAQLVRLGLCSGAEAGVCVCSWVRKQHIAGPAYAQYQSNAPGDAYATKVAGKHDHSSQMATSGRIDTHVYA